MLRDTQESAMKETRTLHVPSETKLSRLKEQGLSRHGDPEIQ